MMEEMGSETPNGSRGASDTALSWIVFGALVAGVIGTIVGLVQSRPRRRASRWTAPGDPHELTPPHGDKLHVKV
jgi:hypothetical protein